MQQYYVRFVPKLGGLETFKSRISKQFIHFLSEIKFVLHFNLESLNRIFFAFFRDFCDDFENQTIFGRDFYK